MVESVLTTITSYWDRPQALSAWIGALEGAAIPEVEHVLFSKGVGVDHSQGRLKCIPIRGEPESIGVYHNMGAELAKTEWIMKLDVDTIPHVRFFSELLSLLESAPPRCWFNVGMLYVNRIASLNHLSVHAMPLSVERYREIMDHRQQYCDGYQMPAATNFVCRREDYLAFGGCDERFRGYGWEDYHQIYMLEKRKRGSDPLPGPIDGSNVTRRCRDEISRPEAQKLFEMNPLLCLLHKWHPRVMGSYRSHIGANREILLECIYRERQR